MVGIYRLATHGPSKAVNVEVVDIEVGSWDRHVLSFLTMKRMSVTVSWVSRSYIFAGIFVPLLTCCCWFSCGLVQGYNNLIACCVVCCYFKGGELRNSRSNLTDSPLKNH